MSDLFVIILASTAIVLFFLGLVVTLLLLNNTRRIRYRAELAELRVRYDREVMAAEREAVQQTLHDLGREMHDNVGQLLAVAFIGMQLAEREKPEVDLRGPMDALTRSMDEVRRLGHDLNTDLWHDRSLAEAISAEAARLERVVRIQASVLVYGPLPTLAPDTSMVLFRVFQEVVQNALKHGVPSTLTFTLDGRGGPLLTVADDGIGFEPANTNGHGGFVNIHKRCGVIGYSATCTTAPGKGCTWRFQQLDEHGT
ncbi:MAG: hypothetical protein JNM62_05380 [Flavobacteriales bacterium]|nr:hypothetical protein [Flavobacteriales bacterium]